MKNAVSLITGWLHNITDVMKALIALGVAVGILYDDYFGVIAGIRIFYFTFNCFKYIF